MYYTGAQLLYRHTTSIQSATLQTHNDHADSMHTQVCHTTIVTAQSQTVTATIQT